MEPKPGFKTSEFWLALTVVLIQTGLPLLLLSKDPSTFEAGVWQHALVTLLLAVAVSVPTAAYSYSRSQKIWEFGVGNAEWIDFGFGRFASADWGCTGRMARHNNMPAVPVVR